MVGARLTLLAFMATTASGNSLGVLYDTLERDDTPTLGVLSQGNYDSVHHLVPDSTVAVIFEDSEHLIQAVHTLTHTHVSHSSAHTQRCATELSTPA